MRWLSLPAIRRFGVAAALLTVTASAAAAQATGTIRGRVIDGATARPIADASVTLTGTRLGAVTNSAGDFSMLGVPAGTYEIAARRIGFGRTARQVVVTAGG